MPGFIVSARTSGYSLSITTLKNQGMAENSLEIGYRRAVEAPGGGCQREDTGSSSQISFSWCPRGAGLLCAPRILAEGHTGQGTQNLGFDLGV